MKKTLYTILFVWSVCSISGFSRGQGTVTGHIDGLKADMIYLEYQGKAVDSSRITDGKFVLKGTFESPVYCRVGLKNHSFGYAFWMEDSDIKMTGNMKEIKLTGSKTEDEYQAYRAHMAPMWEREKIVVRDAKAAYKAGDNEKADSLQTFFENVMKIEEDNWFEKFAQTHPRSYVSMNHIYNCTVTDKYEYDRLHKLYRHLDTAFFKGGQWEILQERYHTLKRFLPGNVFPDFSQTDVYDTPVKLSDYRGKYVLLTFSGSWESSYRASNPMRMELYNAYKDKGLEMLDVLFEQEKEALMKVVVNDKLPWNLVSDYKGWNNYAVKAFMVDHITVNYLIDPHGVIVAKNLFGDELERRLKEVFGGE